MTSFRHLSRAEILAATALAGAFAATPAAAQETPPPGQTPQQQQARQDEDEIVVTATLRETSLIDVPFSINAQTEQDIQRSNATTIEDLSRNVAGLTIQNLGPGQSQVSIRGVSAGPIGRDQPGGRERGV